MMFRQAVLSCFTLGLLTGTPSAIAAPFADAPLPHLHPSMLAFNSVRFKTDALAMMSGHTLGFADPYSEIRQGLLALGMLGLPVVVGLSYKRYRVERCLQHLKQIQRLERLLKLNSKP